MNILHILSAPAAGGAENYIKDLSIAMAKQGHSIHLLFLSNAEQAGHDKEYEADFLEELGENNISYHFAGIASRKKPWIGGFKLREIVRKHSIGMVHAHLYYGVLFSIFLYGVPVFYTHHSVKLKISPILFKLLCFRVTAFVAICQPCKSMLGKLTSRPVELIYNAVSFSRVQHRVGKREKGRVRFVFVGRLHEAKNCGLLLKAVSQIMDCDFELKIAGYGSEEKKLKEISRDIGVESRVEFLGNVKDVPSLLYESDVFVMSSLWEGLPIALIEAISAGLPSVVTDVGGCAEIVEGVGAGFVVPSGDDKALAQRMRDLIVNSSLRKEFSQNAIKGRDRFDIGFSCQSHVEYYSRHA